jgi:hypothetical protein
LIFLAHVASVMFLASKAGAKLGDENYMEHDGGLSFLKNENVNMRQIVRALLAVSAIAAAMCISWLVATVKFAESMIKCSFVIWAIFYTCGAVVGLSSPALKTSSGLPALSIICLVLLLFLGCTYCAIRKRIAFASANLKTACAALRAHVMLMPVACLGLLLSFGWCLAWSLAVVSVTTQGLVSWKVSTAFLAFLSFYWGQEVCSNINHVTISGTVSSWWCHPEGDQETLAVSNSLRRALTTSFGSICFGSLLVAICEVLHALLNECSKQSKGPLKVLACCLRCLIGCMENVVRYFNRFAFVYIGLEGCSFCSAASKVSGLFSRLGFFGTVLNDVVISRVLTMGILGVSVMSSATGFGIGYGIFNDTDAASACCALGFAVGYAMASATMMVVSSAVATVYVAFGKSSESLQAYHPAAYVDLKRGWQTMYPAVTARFIDTSPSV